MTLHFAVNYSDSIFHNLDDPLSDNTDAIVESETLQPIMDCSNNATVMSPDFICISGQNDQSNTTLINSIEHQFFSTDIS